MKGKITRASGNVPEGRSIWFNKPKCQKKIREEFNKVFKTDFRPRQNFNMIIKIGNFTYKILGHFNRSRGDFYVSLEEWNKYIGIDFEVGSYINCEILGYEI